MGGKIINEQKDVELTSNSLTPTANDNTVIHNAQLLLLVAKQAAGLGHYVTDPNAGTWTNDSVFDGIYGIDDRFERNFSNWQRIMHPEDSRRVMERFQEAITNREISPSVEYRITRPCDGKTVWIAAWGHDLFDNNGNVVCQVGLVQDITERKQVEAALRQYKIALETTHDGYWMVDSKGFLLEANQAYADAVGFTLDELRGMHISQLDTRDQSEDEVKAHMTKVISQGYEVFETRHRHKDGHEIDFEISTSYEPKSQMFIAFCRDITERKAAEEKIERRGCPEFCVNGIYYC